MDKRMNILVVQRGRGLGGPNRNALRLSRELAKEHNIWIACNRSSWLAEAADSEGIPTIKLRLPGSILNPFAASVLSRFVRDNNIDIVRGYGEVGAMYAVIASRRSSAVPVASAHTLLPKRLRWTRRCDAIIAVSDATKQILLERGIPGEKIYVIKHGVPIELLDINRADCRRRIRSEFHIDESAPLAVAVGGTIPIKGHDIFLKAAAIVRRSVTDARFLVVGDMDSRFMPVLQNIVNEYGLRDSVVFTGRRHDVLDIMAAADVVVLPSRSESLSQVAMESQAVGTPVVASRIGGLPEVVADGESGILVESENVEMFAEAMQLLLTNHDLAHRLGEAGRVRVRSELNTKVMMEKTAALYHKLLSER